MKIYAVLWWLWWKDPLPRVECHAPDMELYRINAQARRGDSAFGSPYTPARRREKHKPHNVKGY